MFFYELRDVLDKKLFQCDSIHNNIIPTGSNSLGKHYYTTQCERPLASRPHRVAGRQHIFGGMYFEIVQDSCPSMVAPRFCSMGPKLYISENCF